MSVQKSFEALGLELTAGALRCACKYGLTAYQVKLGLARTRKLAFPCASLSLEGSCISFPFLGEEDGEGCEREK